jgi:hypothetical protein
MKNVDLVISNLCKVIASLQKREKALWVATGCENFSLDEITDLKEIILDLCDVPKDNSADGNFEKPDLFCRDWLLEELEKTCKTGTGFENVQSRIRGMIVDVRKRKSPQFLHN